MTKTFVIENPFEDFEKFWKNSTETTVDTTETTVYQEVPYEIWHAISEKFITQGKSDPHSFATDPHSFATDPRSFATDPRLGESDPKYSEYQEYKSGDCIIRVDLTTKKKVAYQLKNTLSGTFQFKPLSFTGDNCGGNTKFPGDISITCSNTEHLPLHLIFPSKTYQKIEEHCVYTFPNGFEMHVVIDKSGAVSASVSNDPKYAIIWKSNNNQRFGSQEILNALSKFYVYAPNNVQGYWVQKNAS